MTKRKMYLKMISSSLLRRRSRMLVALLAIAIGATIMSGMVTIYYDIPRQLGKEFRSYGANFVVLPNGDKKIMEEDLAAVHQSIDQNKLVGLAPYRYETTKINQKPYILAGTIMDEAKKNSPFWYVEGEWADNNDRTEVMIGKEIARTLNLSIGDSFQVDGVKYGHEVVGTKQDDKTEDYLKKSTTDDYYSQKFTVKGIITTGGAEEGFIFLNVSVLNELLEDELRLDGIECSIEGNQAELEQLATKLNAANENLVGRPVKRVTQSQDTVLNKLKALVLLVNLVVLMLTMISVFTTMLAVVAERRKEIGLKKALGAADKEIMKEFFGEGFGLGLLGGALGVVLGFFFAQRVSLSVFGRAIEFSPMIIPLTLIASTIITVVASIWPVRQATKVDPAIVLRGE
ncbi:MAG: ABC transporter permease [Eubacteriales bacterium]|nr:ABC transporter permease [Eubacteriales bacterium]